jgi:hypothetical protein
MGQRVGQSSVARAAIRLARALRTDVEAGLRDPRVQVARPVATHPTPDQSGARFGCSEQAIGRAEAMRGKRRTAAQPPTLCLCKSRVGRGLAPRSLLVRCASERARRVHALARPTANLVRRSGRLCATASATSESASAVRFITGESRLSVVHVGSGGARGAVHDVRSQPVRAASAQADEYGRQEGPAAPRGPGRQRPARPPRGLGLAAHNRRADGRAVLHEWLSRDDSRQLSVRCGRTASPSAVVTTPMGCGSPWYTP